MKSHPLAALALVFAFSVAGLSGQETPAPAPTPPAAPANPLLTTLRGLLDSIELVRTEQKEARADFDALKKATANTTELRAAEERIKAAADELAELQRKFENLAAGTSQAEFETGDDGEVSLRDELKVLVEPLLHEFRKSTEKPREIERLRSEVGSFEGRSTMAQEALDSLDPLIPTVKDDELKAALEKLQASWIIRRDRMKNELETANIELQKALKKQESIFGVMGDFFGTFVKRRGKSLALAVLGGLGTFLLLGFLIRFGERLAPSSDEFRRSLAFRFTRLALFVVAIFLGIFAFLGILYAQSDWLLLGLSVIFLLGLLWAAKRALLPFYEQLKTVLNLGPVREGERVIFDGIPWEVRSINFYTDLVNPMLSGGHVRVGLADLTNLHSRPKARKEPLFPCKVGEWVQLSDGVYGEVLSQTPELVRLRTIPGSIVSYQTTTFLGLAPDNHSEKFGLRVTIGIDYQHQAVCTTDAREKLEAFIKNGLSEFIGAENIKGLWVEFSAAGASSLDYVVGIALDGAVAGRKPGITRAVQRLFVDACNKYEWVIPFTQVTIHQAA